VLYMNAERELEILTRMRVSLEGVLALLENIERDCQVMKENEARAAEVQRQWAALLHDGARSFVALRGHLDAQTPQAQTHHHVAIDEHIL